MYNKNPSGLVTELKWMNAEWIKIKSEQWTNIWIWSGNVSSNSIPSIKVTYFEIIFIFNKYKKVFELRAPFYELNYIFRGTNYKWDEYHTQNNVSKFLPLAHGNTHPHWSNTKYRHRTWERKNILQWPLFISKRNDEVTVWRNWPT